MWEKRSEIELTLALKGSRLASSEQMEEATYAATEREKFHIRDLELNGPSNGMALIDIR